MSAGKGDRPRPVNGKVYRENFDYIFRKGVWPWDFEKESHLAFMRSQGFACASEKEAYDLRGLLDL